MNITRRNLLGSFIAGTLLVGSPAFGAIPNRYRLLIEAQYTVIAANEKLMPLRAVADYADPARMAAQKDVNGSFAYVLDVLSEHFGDIAPLTVDMAAARLRLRNVLYLGGINAFSEDELRKYEDFIVCVASVKSLLAAHRVAVNVQQVPQFEKFSTMYKEVILGVINPDAILAIIGGGDSTAIDIYPDVDGDRWERLFEARNVLIANNAEVVSGRAPEMASNNDALMGNVIAVLNSDFDDMPDEEDRELGIRLVTGIVTNPREIDDLLESQIAAIEDVTVNAGLVRTLLYSYRVVLSEDFLNSLLWMDWFVRYRQYMVA